MFQKWQGADQSSELLLIYNTEGRFHALICYVSANLQQGTEVSEETEFRTSYSRILDPPKFHALKTLSEDIICYRNRRESAPAWTDLDPCM
jgi:hypothetical protein